VEDGEKIIDYLASRKDFADRDAFPYPEFIILDIKMPKLNGLEVLEWIKNHPDCAVVPTLILSGSAQERDIEAAYALGANAYLVKPNSFEELQRMLRLTFEYWSMCATPNLPTRCAAQECGRDL
jgi:CheY-like chemotaxis protein